MLSKVATFLCEPAMVTMEKARHLHGVVVTTPGYDSTDWTKVQLGSQCTAHPAVHPSFSDWSTDGYLGKVNCGDPNFTLALDHRVVSSKSPQVQGLT